MTSHPATFGEDRLMGATEAGAFSGTSASFVSSAAVAGTLPFEYDERGNRRFRRSDLEQLRVKRSLGDGGNRLSGDERLALWAGYAIAGRLVMNTDEVLAVARQRLGELRAWWAHDQPYRSDFDAWSSLIGKDTVELLDEWQRLIDKDVVGLLEVLTGSSLAARDLRLVNPFGGILDEADRSELAASFRDYIEQP